MIVIFYHFSINVKSFIKKGLIFEHQTNKASQILLQTDYC